MHAQCDVAASFLGSAHASSRARHPGGVNIFGKGFGNHNHNILMRQHLKE